MSYRATAERLDPQDNNSESDLISSLDVALESVEKGTEPINPQAKVFKRQIESGNTPFLEKPENGEQNIVDAWVSMNRYRLDSLLFGDAEANWFRGKR